jgi:hypothetical protein
VGEIPSAKQPSQPSKVPVLCLLKLRLDILFDTNRILVAQTQPVSPLTPIFPRFLGGKLMNDQLSKSDLPMANRPSPRGDPRDRKKDNQTRIQVDGIII